MILYNIFNIYSILVKDNLNGKIRFNILYLENILSIYTASNFFYLFIYINVPKYSRAEKVKKKA